MQKFTQKQLSAINYSGGDVLISAAAGSGKTSVLVERIMRLITSSNPINIDKLLVVTFTEAAAQEMLHRITQSLSNKLDENPNDLNLRRQLMLLGKANISTIHSFCLKVVRSSFYILDIDPSFKIANTTDIKLLEDEVLTDLFEEWYEKHPGFKALVEMYGDKYSDSSLKNTVLSIYQFALGDPNPRDWLKNHAKSFESINIKSAPWHKLIVSHIKEILKGVISSANKAISYCNMEDGPIKYIPTLNDDISLVQSALNSLCNGNELTYLENTLFKGFSKLPSILKKDNKNENLQKLVKTIRDKEIKAPILAIKEELFFKPQNLMEQDLLQLSVHINNLVDLTLSFYDRFSKAKLVKNILDFNDLEHFAIAALNNKQIQNNFIFEEVLIDEYQDSNYIQESILSKVGKNRFMVGDIKQSIYKFRGAVPSLFLNKYSTGNFIPLSKNFRSRLGVIEAVNFLFSRLLPPTGIVYDENAKLYQGASYSQLNETVEIHLIDTNTDEDISTIEYEAKIIANQIKYLMSFMEIEHNDHKRQLQFDDIAILTRTVSGISEPLVEALKAQNIPAYGESTTGFFGTNEIMTITSFLSIIDNPLQDIPLLAVLKSPIYGIDANALLRIRSSYSGTFYFCTEQYLSKGDDSTATKILLKFFNDLKYFRNMSQYTEISELITSLLERTGFLNYVAAESGQTGVDNIYLLLEISKKQQNKSLYNFVKYIERLSRRKITIGEAKSINNKKAVNVISIHKSKGLEFPVVFVAMMGRKINLKDKQKDLLLHSEYGFGPKYIDLDNRIKHPSIASYALSKVIHLEALSEEIRILYVAATRAKEKLFFTGALNNLQSNFEKWERLAKKDEIQPHNLFNSSTFLDLIMPCILSDKNNSSSIFKIVTKSNDTSYPSEIASKIPRNIVPLSDLALNISNENIAALFDHEYKNTSLIGMPSNISISEIKGNYYKQLAFKKDEADLINNENISVNEVASLRLPSFIVQKHGLTPAQIGNAHHTILEKMNLYEKDIPKLINKLVQNYHLTQEEALAINVSWLQKFLNSSIAKRMQNSKFINKEVPFAMNISPNDAYLAQNYTQKESLSDALIVVHGIIDCYFEEKKGIILLDYKTDNIKPGEVNTVQKRHKVQMDIYKNALQKITGKNVIQSIIYVLSTGEEIEI